jgi:hypothetical protein
MKSAAVTFLCALLPVLCGGAFAQDSRPQEGLFTSSDGLWQNDGAGGLVSSDGTEIERGPAGYRDSNGNFAVRDAFGNLIDSDGNIYINDGRGGFFDLRMKHAVGDGQGGLLVPEGFGGKAKR